MNSNESLRSPQKLALAGTAALALAVSACNRNHPEAEYPQSQNNYPNYGFGNPSPNVYQASVPSCPANTVLQCVPAVPPSPYSIPNIVQMPTMPTLPNINLPDLIANKARIDQLNALFPVTPDSKRNCSKITLPTGTQETCYDKNTDKGIMEKLPENCLEYATALGNVPTSDSSNWLLSWDPKTNCFKVNFPSSKSLTSYETCPVAK